MSEVVFGKLIMQQREVLGWSRETLADLYGFALRDRSMTVKAIEKMEKYNEVPKNMKRRYVLAGLLGLAPATLGIASTEKTLDMLIKPVVRADPVDLVAYRSLLETYQNNKLVNGYNDVWQIVADIVSRIRVLHDNVLYTNQKKETVEVLCSFHLILAEIASEQNCQDAEKFFNRAVILSKDYHLIKQHAIALERRGSFYQDEGNVESARNDFERALTIKNLPPRLKGHLLSGLSMAKAHTATSKQEVTEALSLMDETSKLTSEDVEDETYRKFDEERWHLDRAAVWLGPQLMSNRSPNNALNDLQYIPLSDGSRRAAYRETYSDILQAQIYMDKGDYPFATRLTGDALQTMGEMQSYVHIPDAEKIYHRLKGSMYGKSTALAELGVSLLKTKHRDIFGSV